MKLGRDDLHGKSDIEKCNIQNIKFIEKFLKEIELVKYSVLFSYGVYKDKDSYFKNNMSCILNILERYNYQSYSYSECNDDYSPKMINRVKKGSSFVEFDANVIYRI